MKIGTIALFVLWSSVCLSQTDSMFVQKTDGSVRSYSIGEIGKILFSGVPTSVREQELVQNVLSSFVLCQNYPNPFNPSTNIQYSTPRAGDVEINIFDIQGRLIRTFDKSYQPAGVHTIVWNSRANTGSVVSSGTYFCQVLFDGSALVKKLVLLK